MSPARKGWDTGWATIRSAVGAALSPAATQPDFAISGRGTILSNEINPTESMNHLIWTALTLSLPCGTELVTLVTQTLRPEPI